MKLGIMQPYFFPYLGHFSLIAHCDQWVVFDISQYTRKSWMNRNRILHPKQSWQYISAPVANAYLGIKTQEVLLKDLEATQAQLLGKLSHYRKLAPNYHQVIDLVKLCFEENSEPFLVNLNTQILRVICQYLDIPFNYQVCSKMNLSFPKRMEAGDWALEISKQCGASRYINPSSGRSLFSPETFKASSIELGFLDFNNPSYAVKGFEFEAGLSILDVLMWNSVAEVREMIFTNTVIDFVS
ncbi:WbqC family protein [Motilimonas eburnea]|uniref:WbqC family protein n=1 Tax=Motilimonas eburnea TaxID=1737488 RepID=UPI001E60DC51|nr:WbqC family protein [Motilimonas eburnea]MCE2571526.1 WbqC family protein [Motilimonas eburnea]